jgi:hypothetical protein
MPGSLLFMRSVTESVEMLATWTARSKRSMHIFLQLQLQLQLPQLPPVSDILMPQANQ